MQLSGISVDSLTGCGTQDSGAELLGFRGLRSLGCLDFRV